eukprot:5162273-Pleurochrysis_carterae.AAC.2
MLLFVFLHQIRPKAQRKSGLQPIKGSAIALVFDLVVCRYDVIPASCLAMEASRSPGDAVLRKRSSAPHARAGTAT